MKWLVALLVLLNAVLFGYFKLTEMQPAKENMLGHEAIHPEQLRILTSDELASLPKRRDAIEAVQTALPQSTHCYEWGTFSAGDVTRARQVLDGRHLTFTLHQKNTRENIRFWIYIPPRKSMDEARAKAKELAAMGVEESFIIEDGQWKYAISLGMFKDEKLADRYLDDLRKQGVRSAIKGERSFERSENSFYISNMPTDVAAEIGKLLPEFPSAELKQMDCE